MRDSWDYVEARLAEQRETAERRRRVLQARHRNRSGLRLGARFRHRSAAEDGLGGCRQ